MSFRQKCINEIKAIGITALYFGCWIAALMFLKSLVLAEYQVAFHRWSAALVGALILSKVVLNTSRTSRLEHGSVLGPLGWMSSFAPPCSRWASSWSWSSRKDSMAGTSMAVLAQPCGSCFSRRKFTMCGQTPSACPARCWYTTRCPLSSDISVKEGCAGYFLHLFRRRREVNSIER